MKPSIAWLAVSLLLSAGCGGEPEEPRERFEKPYEDKVRDMEQQNLQRVEDQEKAIDEQSGRRSDREGDN